MAKKKTTSVEVPKNHPRLKPAILEVTKAGEKGVSAVLNNVRAVFVHLAAPREGMNGDKWAYELTALIPKSNTKALEQVLDALKKTVELSSRAGSKEKKQKILKRALAIHEDKSVIKDGDEILNKDGNPRPELQGHYLLKCHVNAIQDKDGNFTTKFPLQLKLWDTQTQQRVDVAREAIADHFYSGVWLNIALSFCVFDVSGSTGVSTYLNGALKLIDDTRLGGHDPFADPDIEPADESEESDDDEY